MNRVFKPRQLSARERDCIMDAARGFTAQQSADRLATSVNIVNIIRQSAQRVLGGRNITHTVVLALINGDFTTDDL